MNDDRARARVRVMAPRGGRRRPTSVVSQINEQTALGEVYMRTLMRSQLRLALGSTVVLGLTVGLLPLALRSVSWFTATRVLGIPLPWLLLGVVIYPFLVLLGWIYVRRAERNEAAFHDLVNRADDVSERR